MSGELVVFWCLATLVVLSAATAAFARSIVNAAYALFFSLLGIAGVYALLGADFLAVSQVVIYVGGIVVLVLFGILLTNRSLEELLQSKRRSQWLALVVGGGILAVQLAVLIGAIWPLRPETPAGSTTAPLGVLLLQKYVIPFEFASLTLLVALIGASYLVRRRERD
ncbi:MAG: NADH-quinone oxidoreductase subunit J [Candidatus Sumerlaeaceae bacterium]|nr:NADH-quinone oxidoreductase subunit J [Candidatus Sumerlaeaceae bacterium]